MGLHSFSGLSPVLALAAAAALTAGPVAADVKLPGIAGPQAPAAAGSDASALPKLVGMRYDMLAERALALRLLTRSIDYSLTVGADGKATDCTLARPFRYQFTTREMCRTLMRSARFEPARNAAGEAVSGTHSGTIEIWSLYLPERNSLDNWFDDRYRAPTMKP